MCRAAPFRTVPQYPPIFATVAGSALHPPIFATVAGSALPHTDPPPLRCRTAINALRVPPSPRVPHAHCTRYARATLQAMLREAEKLCDSLIPEEGGVLTSYETMQGVVAKALRTEKARRSSLRCL